MMARNHEQLSPRARRRARRRASILDAAMELLIDHGLAGLTIHRLAKRLSLTPGALYRYFDSKDAILAELEIAVLEEFEHLFDDAWRRALELTRRRDTDAPTEALFALRVAVAVFLDLARSRRERFHLLSLIMGEPRAVVEDSAAAAVIAPSLRLLQGVGSRFERAAQAGALDEGDPVPRAILLWSSLQGVCQLAKLARFEPALFDIDALGLELYDRLMRGYGATPERIDATHRLLDGLRDEGPLVAPEDDDTTDHADA